VRHNETAMTLPIPSAQRTFGPGRPWWTCSRTWAGCNRLLDCG
jgi:hypothetical protein